MDDLLKKINDLKKGKGADLSMDEDLSIGVMNLISLEEHFFFTGQKTKNDDYFKLLEQTREIRKRMLAKMIPINEGETWCISKHLLAATMRLIEVGTKYQNMKDEKKAKEVFNDAYRLYNLFWGIRLKLIDLSNVKTKSLEYLDDTEKNKPWGVDDIVTKLVDCCRE
jgi:hypothetical protein